MISTPIYSVPRTFFVGLLSLGLLSSPATAATPVRITSNSAASTSPAIATGIDGQSRLVWSDNRDGNNEIYYALVDGFGNRLTADVRVTTTPTVSSTLPRVGVDGQGNAILCWREGGNVWIAKLDRLGNPLVTSRAVSLGFSYVATLGPDLSVQTGGRFAVGFGAQHVGLDDMFIVNFDGGLNKLCQTTNLYTNLTFLDTKVSVSCSGSLNCKLAWQQVGVLDGDNLATVGSASNCARGPVNYLCAGNNFSSPDIHGAGLLYVRSSHVNLVSGSGCGAQLSENPGPSLAPAGDTLSSARSIAVWEDRRSGNSDLYHAVYSNASFTKIGTDSSLITGASASQVPAVSTDRQGTAFVAWQDDRDGNSEIYFTRTPDLSAYRGTITGTVYDAITLAPIPGAVVTLIGPQRPMVSQDFITGTDGRYRITGLVPGSYAVGASSAGHASPFSSGNMIVAGGTLTVDLKVSTGTTLEGGVADSISQLAIGGAQLHLMSANGQYVRDTRSDPEGRYHFDLLAGTFSLSVSMPALGVAGPFFSPTNDLYHSKTEPTLIVGPGPATKQFSLATNTVVLAHGILSNDKSWGVVAAPAAGAAVVRSQLELAGYHTEAIERDWTRSIPDQATELQRWFGHQPFKSAYVIAHSMGGLATRWYIERMTVDGGAARIPLLVTLGTPNHGAPAAADVSDLLNLLPGAMELAKQAVVYLRDMGRLEWETKLLQRWTFLTDLRPNSANLNALNYGNPDHSDLAGRFACLDHEPEQIPAGTRYVTIDGDAPQLMKTLWAVVPCQSDGIVPVASAKLFKTSTPGQSIQNVRTGCLPDPITTGDCGSSHHPLPGTTDYKNSYCVSKNIVDALAGDPIAVTCVTRPERPLAVAADTALQKLAEIDHLMMPGASVVDSFQIAEGDYFGARVRWLRGGARVALQSAGGAVMDSAASVGNPALLYVSDYHDLFARLDVAGAAAGWWRLTTTLTADSAQMISVRPYVSGSVMLDLDVRPARPLPSQPVTVTGTLLANGAPVLGATVSAEVRDPAGTTTLLVLHDDGLAPDALAGDGVYGATFGGPAAAGRYMVTGRASDGATSAYAPRQSRTAFQVTASPSIVLASGDLPHGLLWGYPSDPMPVAVSVHNLAAAAADSVWVSGRDDSSGVAFLDTVVAIPAHSLVTVGSQFASTRVGLHALSFTAVALGDVPDFAAGNHAGTLAEVVPFGGAPSVLSVDPPPGAPPARTYLLTRAVPNPTRGPTLIEFYLPRATPRLRLTVLDAAGRLVSRSEYGGFPAGQQRLSWDPGSTSDGRVTAGVYFYRIEGVGIAGQGRLVIVR